MSQSSIIFAHINARHPRRKLNVTSSLESIIGGEGGITFTRWWSIHSFHLHKTLNHHFYRVFWSQIFTFQVGKLHPSLCSSFAQISMEKFFLLSAKWPEAFSLSPSLTLSLSSLELIENYLLYSSAAASFAYGGNQFEQESSNFGLGLPCFRRQKCCYFLIKTNSPDHIE